MKKAKVSCWECRSVAHLLEWKIGGSSRRKEVTWQTLIAETVLTCRTKQHYYFFCSNI
jgi:hypothetical protein